MPRNRLSSHSIILAMCDRLRVDYDDMVKLIKPLLQQYNAGKRDRDNILDHFQKAPSNLLLTTFNSN